MYTSLVDLFPNQRHEVADVHAADFDVCVLLYVAFHHGLSSSLGDAAEPLGWPVRKVCALIFFPIDIHRRNIYHPGDENVPV